MDFLGIGLPELIIIFTLILIVLGPDEMVRTGKRIGVFANKLINSEHWATVKEVNRQIKHLPNRLAREANIADLDKDIDEAMQEIAQFPEVPISPSGSTSD